LAGKYARQDSTRPNSSENQAEASPQPALAHALPTSRVVDPDLALIQGRWDRLTGECKRRLIEMVQADTPSHVDEEELDEIDERAG
jgi:hypothetical protein